MDSEPRIYSSRIIANYIEYLEKHFSEIDINALLDHARIGKHELSDEGHWLTQRQVNRFHEIMDRKTGNADISREAGRYSVLSKAAIPSRRLFLKYIRPIDGLKAIDRLYPKSSRIHHAKTRVISNNQVEISVHTSSGEKEEPFQCSNRIGSFEAVIKIFTGDFGEISHSECMHTGSDLCRYLITFKERPFEKLTRYRNIGLVAIAPLLAIAFFFLPPLPLLSLFTLCLLGYLGLTIGIHRLEKAALEKTVGQFGETVENHSKETRLRYNYAMLAQEIGAAVTALRDFDHFIQNVVTAMENHLDYRCGMIMLIDDDGKKLNYINGYGLNENEKQQIRELHLSTTPDHDDIFSQAVAKQQPVLISDKPQYGNKIDPKSRQLLEKLNATSLICSPIVFKGQTLGLLLADTPVPERALTRSDEGLLSGLASQTALGIPVLYKA